MLVCFMVQMPKASSEMISPYVVDQPDMIYVDNIYYKSDSNQIVYGNRNMLADCQSNYGYNHLSQDEQLLYNRIKWIYQEFYCDTKNIDLTQINSDETGYIIGQLNRQGLSDDDILKIYMYLHYDNPMFYYMNLSQVFYNDDTLYLSICGDFASGEVRNNLQQDLNAKIEDLSRSGTDYDTVKHLYEEIKEDVAYGDISDPICHTLAGWVRQTVVCDGYAAILTASLNYLDIKTITIGGFAQRTGEIPNKQKGHAWNMIWLDSNWYFMDLTWDDQKNGLDYFLKGCSFLEDHMSLTSYHFSDGIKFFCYPLPDVFEDYKSLTTELSTSEASTTQATTTQNTTVPSSTTQERNITNTENVSTELITTEIKQTTTEKKAEEIIAEKTTQNIVENTNISNVSTAIQSEKTTSKTPSSGSRSKKDYVIKIPKAQAKRKGNKVIVTNKKGYCYQFQYSGKTHLQRKNKRYISKKVTVKIRYAKYYAGKWHYGTWTKLKGKKKA